MTVMPNPLLSPPVCPDSCLNLLTKEYSVGDIMNHYFVYFCV